MKKLLPSLMACTLLSVAPFAAAQESPVDPSWSAFSLLTQCQNQNDPQAQGKCVGAIRGIIHGYQYGVLFLGQKAAVPNDRIKELSLCLNGVPIKTLVGEYVSDAASVNPDSLKRTSAETALLGSVHMHHSCD